MSTTSCHSRLDRLKFFHYLWFVFFYHICNLLYINPLTLDVRSKSMLIACRVLNFTSSIFTKYAISVHAIEVRVSADALIHFHLFCHDHINWISISPLDIGTSRSHIVVHCPWNQGFIILSCSSIRIHPPPVCIFLSPVQVIAIGFITTKTPLECNSRI